jgi:hypothetical protein
MIARLALSLVIVALGMAALATADPAQQLPLVDFHRADFTVCQTIAPPPIAGPHETVKRPYPRRNDTA